jgi:hypothetical protein
MQRSSKRNRGMPNNIPKWTFPRGFAAIEIPLTGSQNRRQRDGGCRCWKVTTDGDALAH